MFAASAALKRASTAVATVVCRTRVGVSTKQLQQQQQRGLSSSAHQVEGLVKSWVPPAALTLMGLALVLRRSGSALPPTSDERGVARKEVGWDNFTQKSVKMTDDDDDDDEDDEEDDEEDD